jgi:enoyl reductase-like protein/3-oxoacyl-ACP reductase-like protein/acyl dehydratase
MTLRKDGTLLQDRTLSANAPADSPQPPAARAPEPVHALIDDLANAQHGVALTFAGQGANCLPELAALLDARPELWPWIQRAQAAVADLLVNNDFAWSGLYERGFDLNAWIRDPDARPPEGYLTSSAISQPLIFITQIVRYQALYDDGLRRAFDAGAVRALTGHSQGMMPALLIALSPQGQIQPEKFSQFVQYFTWQGLWMARSYASAQAASTATPMIATSGVEADSLQRTLDKLNRALPEDQRAFIALYNTRSRCVVSGPAPTLERLQQALDARAEDQQRRKRAGRFAGRVERPTVEFLAVGAAFHSPFMRAGLDGMLQQVRAMGFRVDPADLHIDALSPEHGRRFQDAQDLTTELVTAQFVRPVRWTQVTAALADRGDLSLVLDLGPSDAAARLTRANLRGTGLRVLALTNPDDQRALLTPGAPAEPPTSWRRFQPRLLTLPDRRVVVDNLYTRSTGQSPMILPGMTPTTADAEIVAAAANAGFTAELAGGGQVTAEIFAERLRELSERLQPGREIVFNALFLDPWLWDLHLGRQRLVQKARRAGAPIRGVTISAGMPAPDDAARLLDELAALGIWHNAFKPGTLDQIQHVARIARAAPQHTIFVHLEGGRAGGHHSWEDLEQLLLDGYHLLRAEPNLVLCVGGGVATPARAAALLTGRWSQAHGLPPMPVDAILLGTVTMACAEARTSPAVKAALASAPGADQWVFSGEVAGGVTSGRSQLNADIHYLDNAAARCGRLLDEVAGDADAVLARRDELIAALNATAKPYFGDLDQMTYLDVARRMTQLMAIGQRGRYEDGPWLDRSWRLRVLDLLRRAEARLSDLEEGAFPSAFPGESALDDPAAALDTLASRYPDAARRRLHPADQDFFLALCRRPGKPVNFVPVIDADVRRWFKSDSLWQSHDPRYTADQVLIIPGPEALRGIEQPDEPVADLLARFEQALIDELLAQGVEAPPAPARHLPPRDHIPRGLTIENSNKDVILRPTNGGQPDWFSYVSRGFQGDPARLLGERRIFDAQGRSWPNPLRQLCAPAEGASLTLTLDDAHQVQALTWRGPGDNASACARVGDHGELRLEVRVPALDPALDPAVYLRRLHLRDDAFVEAPEGRERALRDFYHDALFGARLQPAPLFDEVVEEAHIEPARVEGYRALTGARQGDPALPLNMAFSQVWRPLMRALSCDELSGGLLDLVHLSNEISPGPGWPALPGEPLVARARVTRVEDAEAGRAVTTLASLWRGDQRCATITSRFFIRGDFGRSERRAQAHEALEASLTLRDQAAADLLTAQPWLQLDPGVTLCDGMQLLIKATLTEDRPRVGDGRWGAAGELLGAQGERLGVVSWSALGAWTAHPVREAAALLAAPGAPRRVTARKTLASAQVSAPTRLEPFAQVSADLNPIHRSALMAALAGLGEPIVHGMWSAARMHSFLVAEVAGGSAARVTRYAVEFLAPALRGEALVMRAARVGVASGDLEVEVTAAALRGGAEVPVAKALATVRAPKTAYVLPGQGIQQQGMGMQGYGRSAAAREVWDRADRYTRRHLGFSILRVVRENPTELIVQGVAQLHPKGVLHLTQFTQVAMAVTAMAQVAELREAGVLVDDAITCGHSVGEYNALAAIAQVLPLEDVVAIVYQRGGVMHQLVPRDEKGASQYRMGVIRPNCANLDHAGAEALVAHIRQETGLALEIVNYNIRGWQYSVTGHKAALERLRDALEARRPADAREPYLEVPGVDVPFHSRVLQGGVESFRQTLDARLPARLDYERLLGRYIPNLVPRPWSLARDYVQEVFDCTQAEALRAVLADFDAWSARPDALARVLLIELLAWQFASPVRWIETQELIMRPVHQGGLGVERVIEVGVGYQPTLVGMARATARGLGHDAQHIEIINIEADAERVFYQDADRAEAAPSDDDEPAATAPAAAATAAPVAAPVATSSAAPVADRPMSVQEALLTVLALQARVRPAQISLDETIDDLFEGVSSRRNQVLLDLGAEFEAGAIDGAHEKPLRALAEELARRNGGYRAPGAYLRAAQEEALGRALGRARLRRREVAAYLSETWGLGDGWGERALCALALEARAGDSGRGGALGSVGDAAPATAEAGRQLLDQLVTGLGAQLGAALGKRGGAASGGGAVDAAAVKALGDQIIGPRGVLAQSARDLLDRLGEPAPQGDALPEADADAARLARWEAEHGPEYERLIQPAFDARRHVALASAWATAQRDIARLYYEGRQGRLEAPQIASEAARLAAFGAEPRAHQTARWCTQQARQDGLDALADALARIAQGGAAPLDPHAARPRLEIGPKGEVKYKEVPASAHDFVKSLASMSPPAAAVAGWEGFTGALEGALQAPLCFLGRTALVTGASPGSIAWEVVRHLLRGGARVVVTTTSATPARIRQYKALYGACAVPGAELHVVPFNQASNQDVDALVDWLFTATTEQAGAVIKVLKRPFAPDLIVPFGALGDVATLDSPSDRSLAVVRALLLGVERLIGAIGRRYRREGIPAAPCHVVLPLSPNHGVFGGDGAYAETKAALEVVLEKWRSEQEGWGRAITLCGATIGWVRGTGLMDANNLVAPGLEREIGALTFSSGEMGLLIAALCTAEAGQRARQAPLMADLTGGFGRQGNIKEVVEGLRADIAAQTARAAARAALEGALRRATGQREPEVAMIDALPDPLAPREDVAGVAEAAAWPGRGVNLREAVVIVGAGEVGPWGHARTRFEVEVHDELSPGGALELAWVTGLIRYEGGRWLDAQSGQELPEARIAAHTRDALRQRGGIRWIEPAVAGYDPDHLPVMAKVYLERDFTFPVSSADEARLFVEADPEHTEARFDAHEETWRVTRRAGTAISVPRKTKLNRRVAGLVPTGFDPARYGLSPDMIENIDRATLFNLIATVGRLPQRGPDPRGAPAPRPPRPRRQHPGQRHRRHAEPPAPLHRRPPGPESARATSSKKPSSTSSPPTSSRATSAATAPWSTPSPPAPPPPSPSKRAWTRSSWAARTSSSRAATTTSASRAPSASPT